MTFAEWFAIKNIDKFEYIRNEKFYDNESKHILDTMIYEMVSGNDLHFSEIYIPDQYFCLKEFVEGTNDCFVDIGAYTGETIETFLWKKYGMFSKIYAFEPMSRQYNAAVKRVNRLIEEWGIESGKIELVKAAVSDDNSTIIADVGNGPSSFLYNSSNFENNIEQINTYTLDMFLGNNAVTFIKADIEGFEMKALKGAEKIIKRDKPKLAICVYHNPNDVLDFIEYLGGIVPEYRFRLRHHSHSNTETVLYCNV